MEEGFKSHGRQLRQSTLSHKPGRYEESQAYGKSCQASKADNNKKDCQIVAHNIAKRGPEQDETPKESPLDVTNDLDWGSPEPEEIGEPVEWCQVTLSGQWIILLALCQYKAFAPATQLLRMKVADIINFVGLYIHCHRETKKWANEINGTPVDVLLQMANGAGASANETNILKRPYLPTDVLWDSEREQAINYLHQVGQRGFVKDVKEWRGHSTAFHTLPIEPEIMAACTMILDKGMGSLNVEKIGLPQTERAKRSLISLGGVQPECHDLAKCMAELQSYLPPLATNTFESMPASNLEALHDPWNHQNAKENGIGSSLERSKELWNNTKHEALVDHGKGPATTFDFNQYFAQDKLSVAKSSHVGNVYFHFHFHPLFETQNHEFVAI
ncbi:hypothetical protein LZ32DRAFT_541321 [Colletotrichum eremochloae]|nr:hypothetical protein LZ32DRAFT_541321 [Colletotrichum eremochloae]